MFVDVKLDESYTPNKISIRVGTNEQNLREVRNVDLEEPEKWVKITLCEDVGSEAAEGQTDVDKAASFQGINTFLVQIGILSNHQNGRDTHVRQIKVIGSRQ